MTDTTPVPTYQVRQATSYDRVLRAPGTLTTFLPPGEYYVGDPCYVLGLALYRGLHDAIFPEGDPYGRTLEVAVPLPDGPPAVMLDFRTAHGDGRYPVRWAYEAKRPRATRRTVAGLGVDSGGLAVVDRRLCDPEKLAKWGEDPPGVFITLDRPTRAVVRCHQLVIDGVLSLDTDPRGEDEDADRW